MLRDELMEELGAYPLPPETIEKLEMRSLIADQEAKDRMYRESVIQISREIYMNAMRETSLTRIAISDIEKIAVNSIEAARVFVEQVRDNL